MKNRGLVRNINFSRFIRPSNLAIDNALNVSRQCTALDDFFANDNYYYLHLFFSYLHYVVFKIVDLASHYDYK